VALIATYTPSVAGTPPTFANSAAGDTAPVGDRLYLIAKNTTGAPVTVTLVTPGLLPTGDAYPDKVYTIPATTGEQWIPLLQDYADPSDGLAHLTWSAPGAGVTRAVVRV